MEAPLPNKKILAIINE